ncbi:MAG TPA: ABC transporter permease [Candidatus Acidoferrales bacterium]|jgi:putative ABC transport system permease protein|nr:ABC transporter permease [Candidatus Acidoferrales bacterium]
MFGRILVKLLRGSRGRLSVALIAVISGAAVISALLNLDLDIERKLTQEFRLLGANLVISANAGSASSAAAVAQLPSEATSAQPGLLDEKSTLDAIESVPKSDAVVAAPFLYLVARSSNQPVVVSGTWLDETRKLEPTWKIEGSSVDSRGEDSRHEDSRDDSSHCLVGRNVAAQFHLFAGSPLDLNYQGRRAHLTVSGIVDSGGPDDDQIFVNLPVAQALAALPGKIELVQLSASGNPASISAYSARLAKVLPNADVRPIRQVTEAEGALLNRTRLLIVSMVLLILVLTALCVLATMSALAMERREDVGLMKALGGSISRIVALFLSEVAVLAAAGGLIGCLAGLALSSWMGQRVFSASITPRWEVFPLTIGLMILVAMTGALPLRLLGKVKPAVILRGE